MKVHSRSTLVPPETTQKEYSLTNDSNISAFVNPSIADVQDEKEEDAPLVISLTDEENGDNVPNERVEIESENLSNYSSNAVSLSKFCPQCGKELRDKWALRRHMDMHAFSEGIKAQEPLGESNSVGANESIKSSQMGETFDPKSIDKEIEFLHMEAKKYEELDKKDEVEEVKAETEKPEEENEISPLDRSRQNQTKNLAASRDQPKASSAQMWQLPTQNTCEVFLQPSPPSNNSALPPTSTFQHPWNFGQNIQNNQVQNIQQQYIYRGHMAPILGAPVQNMFGNIATQPNFIPASSQNITTSRQNILGSRQDILASRQNISGQHLQILPHPGYGIQYLPTPSQVKSTLTSPVHQITGAQAVPVLRPAQVNLVPQVPQATLVAQLPHISQVAHIAQATHVSQVSQTARVIQAPHVPQSAQVAHIPQAVQDPPSAHVAPVPQGARVAHVAQVPQGDKLAQNGKESQTTLPQNPQLKIVENEPQTREVVLGSQNSAKENALICNLCDKKFQSSYNVKRHLKTHSNEEIPCTGCGNRFKTNETLTKHSKHCLLLKTHWNTQYPQEGKSRGKQKSENVPLISSTPQGAAPLPPSLTLSVSLEQDVLQKFAQMDRIMQDLQQLTC